MTDEFEDQLQSALIDRPTIEQAKGILAHYECATPEEAFDTLLGVAKRHEVPVRDLAGALVQAAAGEQPADPQLRKVIWQEWRDLGEC